MKKTVILLLFATFALMANAQNAEQVLSKVDSLRNEKNYMEAIALLEKSIELYRNDTDNYLSLTYSLWYTYFENIQDYEKALIYIQSYYDLIIPLLREVPDEYYTRFINPLSALASTHNRLGNYKKADEITKENIDLIEKHKEYFTNYTSLLAGQYGNLSFYYLFIKEFKLSEQTAQRALEIDSTQTWIKTNLAHALLFQGETAEAESIYGELANTIYYNAETYAAATLDDFEQLEKADIVPPGSKNDFERIKAHINKINKAIEIYKRFEDLWLDDEYDEAITLLQPSIAILPKQHAEWATNIISSKGLAYFDLGNYSEAEKYWLEEKTIREKVLDNNLSDYATTLNNLGALYKSMGNYSEAEKYWLEAKTIGEKVFGKEHSVYINSLNFLGYFYSNMNEYEQAENCFLEVKNIREKELGNEHPDYAVSLKNLGIIHVALGNFTQAEEYFLLSNKVYEEVLGYDHPDYAVLFNNIDQLYSSLGDYYYAENDYIQAENYYTKTKNFREKVLGKDHPDYSASLNILGRFYSSFDDYKLAENYYLEAKAIREKVLGKDHPDYALSLNNLGMIYHDLGDYIQAEKYLLEAKSIIEKVLGKEHSDYAISVNNLGSLYFKLGDYVQTEKYFLEAKNIWKKIDHPDYFTSVNNLGSLYFNLEDYEQAEKYFLEAKNIIEKVFGKESIHYAATLNNLGALYVNMDDYEQAATYFIEAIELKEKLLGKYHHDYAGSLNNLGYFFSIVGEYMLAEDCFLEAKDIIEKVLGKTSLEYTRSLVNLRQLYIAMEEYEKAIILNNETCELITKNVDKNIAFFSEQQRIHFWNTQEYLIIQSYGISWFYPVPSVNSLNYNNTLFTKGLLLRTTNNIRDAIYSSGNEELVSQFEQLGNLRKQIRNLQQKEDYDQEQVQSLQDRADQLDRAVTQSSQAYRDLKADISMTWQDVQKQLKPDEAAIEFVDCSLYDTKWADTTIYAALVLRPGMDAPAWIPLCEEKDLQACFDRTKGISDDRLDADRQKTHILYNIYGNELYNLIWQPLEQELNGVKTVYYAPSGLLHKVSFDAIPVDGARLFDRYEMKLVSSTREVRRLKEAKADTLSNSTVLYGGIIYDTDSVSLQNEAARYAPSQQTVAFTVRGSAGAMEPWKKLEGSQREMEQIAAQLNRHQIDNTTFTGFAGNEESFKSLSGKNTNQIVISTHGFFLEDIQKDNNADLIRRLGGGGSQKPFENPLLRSGLVMAGGNRVWTGQPPIEGIEDGILTADEISQLNLVNTRLVVLSACQTGLGEVKNSEGVFGLQRAFKLAGVESLIMSLWEVDDTATQIMMSVFYENWLGGKTKQEAFRIAQRAVREYTGFDYSSPYYWAAFVMMD